MGRTRHVILMNAPAEDAPPVTPGTTCEPLGKPADVLAVLARFNTAPDGSAGSMGIDRLYGPGFIAEIPTSLDQLSQLMVHIDDDETAWPVMQRLCKETGWAMCDMESGRRFI